MLNFTDNLIIALSKGNNPNYLYPIATNIKAAYIHQKYKK